MDSKKATKEFETVLANALKEAYPDIRREKEEIHVSVSVPRAEYGDLSSSLPLGLARKLKTNPGQIAEALSKAISEGSLLQKSGIIGKISAEGGYLNAWIDEKKYSERVLKEVITKGQSYGNSDEGQNIRMIVEFPSVNPNKPWHIGHLRNALLGDSISNIFKAGAFLVEKIDYIDDLGLQMAEILWGMGIDESGKDVKYDRFLGEEYVKANKKIKEAGAEEQINTVLKMMEEEGSPEATRARRIAERSVMAQYETAFSYGIYHDVMIWESDIIRNRLVERTMELLREQGISQEPKKGKYAGCVVIETEEKDVKEGEEKVKVFIRSNGVATYIAKDLAFHMWKLGLIGTDFLYRSFVLQPNGQTVFTTSKTGEPIDFGNANFSINIIGSAQQYPQKVLKEVLDAVGKNGYRVIHVPYGEVSLKEGSLSGRKGGWLGEERDYTADDLLKEMKLKTMEKANEAGKNADGNGGEVQEKLALAAIKFEFLRMDPAKKIVFEWERALDLSSNSGPYCMYMYARCSRILEKTGIVVESAIGIGKHAKRDIGFELVKELSRAEEVVSKARKEYRPDIIAEYVLRVSQLFGKFYESVPVLNAEEDRKLRVATVFATRQVIYNMLGLLGIKTLEKM